MRGTVTAFKQRLVPKATDNLILRALVEYTLALHCAGYFALNDIAQCGTAVCLDTTVAKATTYERNW